MMEYKSTKISIPDYPFSAPFWCLNGHVHTIGSSLVRRAASVACKRITLSTPDNDFLDVDYAGVKHPKGIIVLLHGLEGSSKGYYIREMMAGLMKHRFSVVALNFRSCSGRMNKKRRFYHSGETTDVRYLFEQLKKKYTGLPVGAAGFSLGGNVLLKYLGEEGHSSLLNMAVAISVPYDLKQGSLAIGSGWNRIYEQYFLRSLTKKLRQKRAIYPDIPSYTGKTLYDFDNQVTSVLHGFKNAEEYYQRCSAKHFLSGIKTPVLLVHAQDDPMCKIESMPIKSVEKNRYIYSLITGQGGHVGFWSKPAGWLQQVTADFFNQIVD